MSRFFATGSDSDSDTSSENVPIIKQQTQMVYYSDSDDNKKRVIRSAYEKKRHEITVLIDKLKNLRKIKDFTNMVSAFEDMTRIYQKSASVLVKTDVKQMPRFYVRALVELEDFIQEVWEDKDYRKTLYKNNSKSLATLRQKLRKYNKEHEKDLTQYRENPVLSDVSDEDSDDESDDDDKSSDYDDEKAIIKSLSAAKKTTLTGPSGGTGNATASTLTAASVAAVANAKDSKKTTTVPVTSGGAGDIESDRESNDSFWQQDSDTESSSSDNAQYTTMRERFLKKSTVTEKEEDEGVAAAAAAKKKERKEKEKLRRAAKEQAEEDDEGGEWEMVKGGPNASTEKFKMFAKDEEITPLAVVKKLNEIISYRGKKKSSRREILNMINELHTIAEEAKMNVAILLKIRYSLIIAIYDYNFKVSDAMKPENWENLLMQLEALMNMLLKNPQSVRFSMMLEQPENLLDASSLPFVIRGSVLIITEKMDEEFTKLIKDCDCHSNEYVERLKNEPRVVSILTKLKQFLELTNASSDELCAIYLRVVEHMYYKVDSEYMKMKLKTTDEQNGDSLEGSSLDEINNLCKYIYANDSTDRLRTRAIMCHIYHHALHKNWYKARDLFLMSHLQETISFSDPSTQILYNRMIANLGLCAFRHGNIRDAHNCLVDLMVSGRQKELLAQGMISQKQIERSKEQEKIEKLRQIPFHMHINMEMLECVYLISAMLIEIPYMAAHEFDARRKMISKTFYQLLRNSERQNLLGPPETMREHIVAATKAMRSGQWQQCVRYLIDDKMNKKIWDLFHDAEEIRKMLSRIVREEALRTYLFTYSKVYDSISMEFLGKMFDLDRSVVHSIISKMIINEELMASLDEPTQSVVMHRTEPSRLQSLALQLADKATNFLDTKERILEAKQIAMMPNSSRLQMYRNNERQNYRNSNQSPNGRHHVNENRQKFNRQNWPLSPYLSRA